MACFWDVRIRRSEIGDGRWGRGVKAFSLLLEDWPGAVGGTVVNDDDFVRDTAKIQFEVQVLDSGCDAAFLVARRNDD